MPCMYQVCKFYAGGKKIRVIASGLTIGEAATLRSLTQGAWMRHVRYPWTA